MTQSPKINTDHIKAAQPPETVLARLGMAYKRKGRRLFTDCPGCGKDKFDVHAESGVFNCFVCDVAGGDVIALVQIIKGCGFVLACEFLSDDVKKLTQADQIKLEAARKKADKQRAKEEAAKIKRDLARMIDIRKACVPVVNSLAEGYLQSRGLSYMIDALGWRGDNPTQNIFFHPGLAAKIEGDGTAADRWIDVGTWPAMIAIGRDDAGHPVVMHRTFITSDGAIVRKVCADDLPSSLPEDIRHRWRAKQMIGAIGRCTMGVYLGSTVTASIDEDIPIFVGEGIESSGAPAAVGADGVYYAALSLNRIVGSTDGAGFHFPDTRRPRIILADNDLSPTIGGFEDDPDNAEQSEWGAHKWGGVRRAKSLFTRAAKRLSRDGGDVGIFIPPRGMDPNDVLLTAPENVVQADKAATSEAAA